MDCLKKLVLVLLLCILSGTVLAQESLQKIACRQNYGLGIEKEKGYYPYHPVTTFIPTTFLLFDIDFKEPDLKVNEAYLAATTQDGVRVYMLESAVSKFSFTQIFSQHHGIIFNSDFDVCLNPSCDINNDDELLRIRSGEVFKTVGIGPDGLTVRLAGDRGTKRNPSEIVGYIRQAKLDQLNKKAIVTYASQTHPRYKVIKKISSNLNTKCGEKIESHHSMVLDTITDTDRLIIDSFNLANIKKFDDETFQIQFEKSYGDEGKEIEYRVYEAFDRREQPERKETYIAQTTYLCDEQVIGIRNRIEKVVMLMKESSQTIVLESCSTPKDLLKFTQAPYLFSINNATHYLQLMENLSHKFQNRAIAGYFLAEFNRSCKGKYRKIKAECQYKEYYCD